VASWEEKEITGRMIGLILVLDITFNLGFIIRNGT
jgi:hypothetical protein